MFITFTFFSAEETKRFAGRFKHLHLNWTEFFCGMVDRRKAFSLISSRDHCGRSSPSRISDTPRAGFEPAQNLISGLVEWSCAVVITTTPQRRKLCSLFFIKFLFFHKMIALQNCEKCFLFHLKSCFRSRDIQIFVFFPLPFHFFQIQKGKWKWNN